MERIITYSLTENFIRNLGDFIEKNYLSQGKDISRLALVFGGRRPSLFLKKELFGKIKKSFFPPRFFSIDEFIEYILLKKEPFLRISDLDASFIIYNLARDIAPELLKGRKTFSRFLPWAREILAFIEQLDLEDIEAGALKNLQFKAAIGYDVPENINTLLKSIISLREAYHSSLKAKHTYSRGLRYLLASKYIEDCAFAEFDQIFFCDFFYRHKTEADIIKTLYDAKKAVLFFQEDKKENPSYNLSLRTGFDVHSEAGLVRELLKDIKNLDKTVIVLPEPDNVVPLLSEISSQVDDFNVSIGYPLKRSALYSIFDGLFKAQETRKGDEYYARDYLKALSHPLIKNLKILSDPSITRVLVHKIEEILLGIEKTPLGGSLFFKLTDIQTSRELYELALETMKRMDIEVSWDELKKVLKEMHQLLFYSWEKIDNFYDFSLSLEGFLEVLVKKSFLGKYPLNLKMAEKIFSLKDELNQAPFNKEPFPPGDIFKIFKSKLDSEKISFSGSPLKGLQILGLFETRSLNFENVIFMDVNESILPNLKIYEPLIPREVMISLGLNRLEKEEEIQRYQFRRLISSAKNVYLVYQERDDKEKSRFIEELIWEKQKKLNSLEAFSIPRASFRVRVLPRRLAIKKSPDILKFLKEREYSPSSINTYLSCPLRFYYQYVLGIEEKEDLLGEPEGVDIGTFIHELLEETFAKFIGRKPLITAKFRDYFFAALDKKFEDEFQKKMKGDAFLIKEILRYRLERFLDNEKERDVREIIALEKTFEDRIKLADGYFKFKAIVDRLDRLSDDSLLIIDYKTGSIDMPADITRIEEAGFSREALKNTVKSFQLPLYLYFVDKTYKEVNINACLYSLKDLQKKFSLNKKEIMAVYLKALEFIMLDILNPETPFRADEEDNRQCPYCPFFYLCR